MNSNEGERERETKEIMGLVATDSLHPPLPRLNLLTTEWTIILHFTLTPSNQRTQCSQTLSLSVQEGGDNRCHVIYAYNQRCYTARKILNLHHIQNNNPGPGRTMCWTLPFLPPTLVTIRSRERWGPFHKYDIKSFCPSFLTFFRIKNIKIS
jgi:hypothetical protein